MYLVLKLCKDYCPQILSSWDSQGQGMSNHEELMNILKYQHMLHMSSIKPFIIGKNYVKPLWCTTHSYSRQAKKQIFVIIHHLYPMIWGLFGSLAPFAPDAASFWEVVANGVLDVLHHEPQHLSFVSPVADWTSSWWILKWIIRSLIYTETNSIMSSDSYYHDRYIEMYIYNIYIHMDSIQIYAASTS